MQYRPQKTEPTDFAEELVKACEQAVRSVRVAALRDEPFYGMVSSGLTVEIGDFFGGTESDTLATDGSSIFVNPEYFMSKEMGKRKTVVIHEIAHVANGHHLRRDGRDQWWWNLACDYAINIILRDSGQEIDDNWACDEKYRGWSAERIYADIYPPPMAPPEPPPPDWPTGSPPPGDQTGPGTQGEKPEEGKPKDDGGGAPEKDDGAAREKKEREKHRKPNGKVLDGKNKHGDELGKEEKEKRLKDLAKNIEHARSAEKSAGKSSSASEERAMDAIVSPEVGWQARLAEKWSDIGDKEGETWRRFDRRGLMSGMYIPAKERRAINHIVFAMDISSSVGREEHGVLIDKMEELREATPCKLITIVPFNNTVQQRQIVEVEQYDELPRMMDVGGGTSFAPVFNWIRRLVKRYCWY